MTQDNAGERWIGSAVRRFEDLRLLTGRGQFVDDIRLPGALHGAVLRSPHAHARVGAIDVAGALALPGVVAVYTAADLGPADRPLPVMIAHPNQADPATQRPLAKEFVHHVGDPVAFVVAESRYIAEDALDEIAVDYEPLSAVASLEEAVALGAPVAHAGREHNVAGEVSATTGDPGAAFASAYKVLDRELRIHRGCAQPMETRGVAALPGADGALTVWTSTQAPHRVRKVLAETLERSEETVRVISPDVGGAFGMKGNVYPEEVLVACAALRLGRPVRWFEDRREHFLAATQERDQIHRVSVAVDEQGRILALRDHFLHDTGAYVPYGMVVAVNTLYHLHGPYRIPALDLKVTSVYTNKSANAPYRGAGRPQATFILERMMDQIAAELGLDPAEVRRRNLIDPAAMPYDTGLRVAGRGAIIYDSGDYLETLSKALAAIGYDDFQKRQAEARIHGRLLGIGVACYNESSGSGPFEGAKVRVDRNGRIFVYAPTGDSGQGHETTFAQICADVLGVTPDAVQVVTGDTGTLPYGVGTFGTRTAALAGSAVLVASQEVKARALSVAAAVLGRPETELELHAAGVMAPDGRVLPLGRLVDQAPRVPGEGVPGLEATHYFRPEANVWPSGACAAIVEVEPRTGMVRVEQIAFVHDCGVVLNPLTVQGQVEGGVAQGIAGALFEELRYDEQGQLLTTTFMDYLMPTAMEVAPIRHDHVVCPSPHNPLGVKGAGESGVIPVAPAIAQAIEDALGGRMRVDRVPVRPEEVWQALAAGEVGS